MDAWQAWNLAVNQLQGTEESLAMQELATYVP